MERFINTSWTKDPFGGFHCSGDVLWSKQKRFVNHWLIMSVQLALIRFSDDTEIQLRLVVFSYLKIYCQPIRLVPIVTGHLVFVYPQAFHVYDYDGDPIGYDSEQLNFLITPNHRCLIKNGSQYPVNMDWFVTEAGTYKSRSYVFSKELIWAGGTIHLLRSIMSYLGFGADGSIETGDNAIWITQKKNYVDYAKDLLSVLDYQLKSIIK